MTVRITVKRNGPILVNGEVELVGQDGNAITPPCFTDEDVGYYGRLVKYIGKAITIAVDRQQRDEERALDEATGLPNARYFRSRLQAEISRARRYHNQIVVAMCAFRGLADGDGEARGRPR